MNPQLEDQLVALSPLEKAHVLQLMARELRDMAGVEKDPGICGGEACIARTRIPVWLLERMRQLDVSEAEILRSYPSLRAEDLVNAWAYVQGHREEIEQDIAANEE